MEWRLHSRALHHSAEEASCPSPERRRRKAKWEGVVESHTSLRKGSGGGRVGSVCLPVSSVSVSEPSGSASDAAPVCRTSELSQERTSDDGSNSAWPSLPGLCRWTVVWSPAQRRGDRREATHGQGLCAFALSEPRAIPARFILVV